MQEPNVVGERQLKFLTYMTVIIFIGYLGMALSYLFEFAAQDIAANPVMTAREFTPVLIIGMCYLVMAFTCGEYFGLLRYQFALHNHEPGLSGLQLIATRALNLFFVMGIFFYFLRAGFKETVWEKIFFVAVPFLLGVYLIVILKRLFADHRMPLWYYRLKYLVICGAILGQFIANMVLFFPGFVATIPLPF